MKRVSVDIGGTFTDCFVVWGERYLETKALTTHQNLALGFNQALSYACADLGLSQERLLAEAESVRYATTLGTNALIERKGPRIGAIVTAGFEATIPLARARGYGDGLDRLSKVDLSSARRPVPLVTPQMIVGVRERVDYNGEVLLPLHDDDVRARVRALVDRGAEAIVVVLVNSVVNPEHELRVQEIFYEEYASTVLGAIPLLLSHEVAGRKGEYVRASSTILDAYLHETMYFAMTTLEQNLRTTGYARPMLLIHNSGGMAQLNSTDALQTIHSGPVAGIAAAENLSAQTGLGNLIATDMGGTSFDIGIVAEGGVKHYDFNPVIDRWLVTVPMVHLVTLGSGGGSIASYDRVFKTVRVGPQSAGSDPGPACYDRGGTKPTVTDADLLLNYLDPANYAGGRIELNRRRSEQAFEDLCDELGLSAVEAAKVVRAQVESDMANGIFVELRSLGYDPRRFTMLAYGGNGPLHCCGIANHLGIDRVLAPPFSSVFAACGGANIDQLHIHERSLQLHVFNAASGQVYQDFHWFNEAVTELERRGREDLLRQGAAAERIGYRLELDMRYGNQMVTTAVVAQKMRLERVSDVIDLIDRFSEDYAKRFGAGSQAPEAGIRATTVRVASYVEHERVRFVAPSRNGATLKLPAPIGTRLAHFVGHPAPVETALYDESALSTGNRIEGPAIVTAATTTYLVEPGWYVETAPQRAVWFLRSDARGARPA